MGLLSPILRNATDNRLIWWCPGCQGPHQVAVGEGQGPRWGWNSEVNKPTFTPSVLVTWSEPLNLHDPQAMQRDIDEAKRRRDVGEENVKVPLANKVCHSFVIEGQMHFLSDCTHPLAGQTTAIPHWPFTDPD